MWLAPNMVCSETLVAARSTQRSHLDETSAAGDDPWRPALRRGLRRALVVLARLQRRHAGLDCLSRGVVHNRLLYFGLHGRQAG